MMRGTSHSIAISFVHGLEEVEGLLDLERIFPEIARVSMADAHRAGRKFLGFIQCKVWLGQVSLL